MRTDTLIDMLARQAGPVAPRGAGRALALALVLATPLSFALMLYELGLNPELAAYARLPMFWVKLGFGLALGAAGLWLALRLARPGVPAGAARIAPVLPIAALWLVALAALALAAPDARPALVLGSTWRVCPPNIAMLSLPVAIGALLALRTAAPTRLTQAGLAAGLLAGGVGTAVYALHCPELAAPFLAVWYVLGALIPAALGAALGGRVLRW
jgi:hypothetical protein